EVCGRPMVAWPILAAREAGAGRVAVIVGPKHDLSAALPEGTETITQPEANGTGGAMRAASDAIAESSEVVVLSGDHPLLGAEIISELLETHRSEEAAATVMTVELDDPGQYGRIVRDSDGGVERIVETKHPESVPQEILNSKEINTGTYCFSGAEFASALERITDDNEAGEFYLGDVLPLLREDGHKLAAYVATDPNVNLGVNTRADLAVVVAEARRKIAERHLLAGVAITDPASTWIDVDVEIAQDAVIEPGTVLRGATRIAAGATIGPHTTILDSEIGENSKVLRSHLDQAKVGANCNVGPFSYLRPGASLADGSKAGAFVEIKNSEIGEGAKVPHLAYVGDTDIGANANLGAGSITANYDGKDKHRTKIGEGARIGVNNSLVAPVEVGEGAYTGAGAVIRSDVPPGSLGVTDASQRNIEDYAKRKMSDTEGEKKE
ncbi:MAG TPA: bifunctional UDP-N-acetylglucosamine diphosphorylase/glucosamine-1-phosphate N-acetyltransferase GlmU, partial [Solirubrobacterales bacterium]|nr:bifunctional UDP-N-acetylglucosamine diphosphorylase/glucosamine-1-phosphate N-acetyltransferase GlmU [Solirubrobacterales bacterium]